MAAIEVPVIEVIKDTTTVRTGSVTVAAALMLAGCRPVSVLCRDGGPMLVFMGDAAEIREKYQTLKVVAGELLAKGACQPTTEKST